MADPMTNPPIPPAVVEAMARAIAKHCMPGCDIDALRIKDDDWRALRGKMISAMRKSDGLDGHSLFGTRERDYAQYADAILEILNIPNLETL